MREKNSLKPRLEALEDRCVPATVKDVAGTLLVSNPVGNLTVQASTNSGLATVTVTDNGGTKSFSGVGKLISITGTNAANTISYTGSSNFNGDLIISTGNGDDNVTVTGPIAGNVTISSGLGNDSTSLSGTIAGNFTEHHTAGSSTLTTGPLNTVIGGNASLYGLGTLMIQGAEGVTGLTVGGNLTLSALSNSGATLSVSGAGNLTVGKSVTLTAGMGASSFALSSGTLAVGGNATFHFTDPGANTLDLSTVGAGSTIGGNLVYTGGSGVDSILFGANLAVAGNATLNTGNGNDDLSGLNSAWSVAGDLVIHEGDGNNVAATLGGTVDGNLTLTQGNGVNGTVTLVNAPTGAFVYHGGMGTNSLTLGTGATQLFTVDLFFGTGTNTLTLNDGDTVMDVSSFDPIIGSGGMDTLNQNMANITNVTFIDFP